VKKLAKSGKDGDNFESARFANINCLRLSANKLSIKIQSPEKGAKKKNPTTLIGAVTLS
jgi:hypothetical protein